MMTAKTKKYEDDDGRVICSMDVEGTRWRNGTTALEIFAARKETQLEQMNNREALRYTWHAILAGLSIVLVFSAVLVLFTLFAINVWFR